MYQMAPKRVNKEGGTLQLLPTTPLSPPPASHCKTPFSTSQPPPHTFLPHPPPPPPTLLPHLPATSTHLFPHPPPLPVSFPPTCHHFHPPPPTTTTTSSHLPPPLPPLPPTFPHLPTQIPPTPATTSKVVGDIPPTFFSPQPPPLAPTCAPIGVLLKCRNSPCLALSSALGLGRHLLHGARQAWECVRGSTWRGKGEEQVVSEVAVIAPCFSLRLAVVKCRHARQSMGWKSVLTCKNSHARSTPPHPLHLPALRISHEAAGTHLPHSLQHPAPHQLTYIPSMATTCILPYLQLLSAQIHMP